VPETRVTITTTTAAAFRYKNNRLRNKRIDLSTYRTAEFP
jgi:hypothetical protein